MGKRADLQMRAVSAGTGGLLRSGAQEIHGHGLRAASRYTASRACGFVAILLR